MKATNEQIKPGRVIVERRSYHYGQQGQTTLAHEDKRELPEHEAIQWMSGQFVSVTWPDGYSEHLDLAVQPMRVDNFDYSTSKLGWVTMANGKREFVKQSRLPNAVYGYYRPIAVTEAEKATFEPNVETVLS